MRRGQVEMQGERRVAERGTKIEIWRHPGLRTIRTSTSSSGAKGGDPGTDETATGIVRSRLWSRAKGGNDDGIKCVVRPDDSGETARTAASYRAPVQ